MTGKPASRSPPLYAGAMNWRRQSAYSELRRCDRTAFAWEWLRRSIGYRQAWHDWIENPADATVDPHCFGLERFEDPDLATPGARPLCCASVDPFVIRASIVDPFATMKDRVDLRILSPLVTLAIDEMDVEHLLLSDGAQSLRIDIIEGTLIGCPSSLRYALEGIAQLRGPIAALDKLMTLIEHGSFADLSPAALARNERWLLELRVADALASGASHQEIARVLFAGSIADQRWRIQSAAFRQRVQRLASGARGNLEHPLHSRWFSVSSRDERRSRRSER